MSQAPTLNYPLAGYFEARVKAKPANIRLPSIISSERDFRIHLNWAKGVTGRAIDVEVDDSKLVAKVVEEDEQQFVVVTVPKNYVADQNTVNVRIRTDDKFTEILTVPIYSQQTARSRMLPPRRGANIKSSSAAQKSDDASSRKKASEAKVSRKPSARTVKGQTTLRDRKSTTAHSSDDKTKSKPSKKPSGERRR